jgi:hypothetical protein
MVAELDEPAQCGQGVFLPQADSWEYSSIPGQVTVAGVVSVERNDENRSAEQIYPAQERISVSSLLDSHPQLETTMRQHSTETPTIGKFFFAVLLTVASAGFGSAEEFVGFITKVETIKDGKTKITFFRYVGTGTSMKRQKASVMASVAKSAKVHKGTFDYQAKTWSFANSTVENGLADEVSNNIDTVEGVRGVKAIITTADEGFGVVLKGEVTHIKTYVKNAFTIGEISLHDKEVAKEAASFSIAAEAGATTTFEKTRRITREVSFSTKIGVGAEIEVKIAANLLVAKGDLTTRIKGTIERTIGEKLADTEEYKQSIKIDNAKIPKARIYWIDIYKSGTLKVTHEGQTYSIPFEFPVRTSLVLKKQ